jgi:hypothetical protein
MLFIIRKRQRIKHASLCDTFRNYLTDYLTNRLGYWLFIDGVDPFTPTEGAKELIKLQIANRGFAKCYNKYEMKIRAVAEDGAVYYLNNDYPDTTLFDSDTVNEVTLSLDYASVPEGKYTLELGLFFGERPIMLAMKEETRTEDGFYRLTDLTVAPID